MTGGTCGSRHACTSCCPPPRVFATPGPERLQRALDAALVTRQAVIEGKRRQLLQFMNMAPKAPWPLAE